MRAQRRFAATAAGLLLAVLAAGCRGAPSPTAPATPATPAKPPVRIGVITSQSGALAGYGLQEIRGLMLGLEYGTAGTFTVAGHHLDVIVRDDEGKPEVGAAQAADLLGNGGVDILQGAASSAVAAQVIPVVRQYRKPFIIAPAADDALTGRLFNKYVFRVGATASQEILAGAAQAARLGQRVAILAPDSAWGDVSVTAWQSVMRRQSGVSLLPTVYVPLDTADFAPYLQRLAAPNPDVCVLLWSGEGVVQLFQQVAQAGLQQRLKLVTLIGDSESIKLLQELDGLIGPVDYYYTFPRTEANDWLVAKHRERFGRPPDLYAASGFDAGVAIAAALDRAGGNTGGDRLVTALEALSWGGVKGAMRFRKEDHQALQSLYIAEMSHVLGALQPVLLREIPPQDVAPPLQVSG